MTTDRNGLPDSAGAQMSEVSIAGLTSGAGRVAPPGSSEGEPAPCTVPAFRGTVPAFRGTVPAFRGTVPAFRGTVPAFRGCWPSSLEGTSLQSLPRLTWRAPPYAPSHGLLRFPPVDLMEL